MDQKRHGTVEERRPAVRVFVDIEARYSVIGAAPELAARVIEISASGLRLRTTQKLKLGAFVDIAFAIGDASRRPSSRSKMNVRARVVRIIRDQLPGCEYALRVAGDQALKNGLRQAVLAINLATPTHVRQA